MALAADAAGFGRCVPGFRSEAGQVGIGVRAGVSAAGRRSGVACGWPGLPGWDGWFLAEAYVSLGDRDEAFRWLEEAYKARMSFLPWIRDNHAYAPLHGDPRFEDLVKRMKLPD
jgi:hypothetical protein